MNTKYININETYKSYPALCIALDEKPQTKKFKKLLHFKNISRYIHYDKVGQHSFLIKKIYSDPLPINLNYCNDLDFIIDLIFDKRNTYFKQSELLKELETINSDYIDMKIKELEHYNLSNETIEHVYNIPIDLMKDNIERALKRIRSYSNGFHEEKWNFDNQDIKYKVTFIDSYIKEVETRINKIDSCKDHNITNDVLIGIYAIINKVNNRIYIGSSININARIGQHKNDLYNNVHTNKQLQTDYNYYGSHNFKYTILELIPEIPKLPYIELYYIDQYGGLKSSSTYNKSDPTKEYEIIRKRGVV